MSDTAGLDAVANRKPTIVDDAEATSVIVANF